LRFDSGFTTVYWRVIAIRNQRQIGFYQQLFFAINRPRMPDFLRYPLLVIFLAAFFFIQNSALAQVGCNGFDGAPQPSGGVNSINNGTLCLNAPSPAPAEIEILASNVADGNNPNNFAVIINWDDGSAEQIIAFGGPVTVLNTGPHSYRIPSITHQFLPRNCLGGNGRQCAYKPRVYLRIAGTRCGAEFGNPPDFFRFNTDDECSGVMQFSETATSASLFEVCAGASTTVTFTDRTILNCLPPQEITGLNSTRRWRRFVYGTSNTITGTVLINGVAQTFPFNNVAAPEESTDGLTSSGVPFAVNTTQSITIPATAQVGDEFHLQLQYWNFCNQFTAGAAPVTVDGIIRVVDQPSPPTAVHQTVCNGTTPLPTFRVNFAPASSSVLWYRDNAGVPGAAITNPNGTNSKDLPASAYPGGITITTAGVYTVWASYRSVVGAGTLLCESQKIPVTLTIRESLPIPGPISGDNTICNGTANESYTVPIPAAAMPIGGATQYQWVVTDASDVTVTDVTLSILPDGVTAQATFSLPVAAFGGQPSVIRKIRVRRRYNVNATFPAPNACVSSWANFPITVFRNTDDGTISGGGAFCQGEDLGNVTWNPGVGNITAWQISSNAGAYVTIPSFGTSNPVSPTTLGLTPGTHLIRAIVQNGACPADFTDDASFTITANPDVSAAGADQLLCIPAAGLLQTNLAGNTPGAGVTSLWTMISGPGTPVFADATLETSMVTVDLPGDYIFRWTLSNGSCTSIDDVLVSFGKDPSIPAPSASDVCGLTATLSAVLPTYENAEWNFVSGPGAAGFIDDTTIPASVTVDAFGFYTFSLTFSSGNCAPRTTNVSLTFAEPLTSTPETDKTVCVDDLALTPISLTGTIAGGSNGGGNGDGQWEISGGSGTGTFTTSGGAVGSAITGPTIAPEGYTPSLADYGNGSVVLQLTAIGNICPDVSTTITITFDKKPDNASVGPDLSTCGVAATLDAVAPNEGGIGTWSVITVGPSITDPNDENSGVSNLQNGVNQFQWSVASALGTCPVTDAPFNIDRITAPVANSISPSDLCETAPNTDIEQDVDLVTRYNTLITGGAAGVTVQWFTNPGRTTAVPDVTSEDVASGSIYYIRVSTTTVPVCSSDGIVNFTVNAKPFVANLSPGMCEEVYQGGVVNNVILTDFDDDVSLNVGNRSVAWFTDAALTTPVATPGDMDNVIDNATFYAEVTNTLTTCANIAEVIFNVNPIPDPNPIDGPVNICFDPDEVHFFKVNTLKPNHTYQWTIPPQAVNVTGITDDFFVSLQFPTVVAGGLDILALEISPEGCFNDPDTLHVDIEGAFAGLTITGDDQICDSKTGVEFETQNFPYTYLWTVPAGSTIINGQGTNKIVVNLGSLGGDVIVTPSTNNCTGPGDTLAISILSKPILDNFDKTICSKDSAEIYLGVISGSALASSYVLKSRVDDAGIFTTAPAIPPDLVGDSTVIYNDSFENKTGGPLNVRYTIIPVSADLCEGNPRVLTVRVNPEPQMETNLSKDLCSEEITDVILRPAVGSAFANTYIITSIDSAGLSRVNGNPAQTNVELTDEAIKNDRWLNVGPPNASPTTISYFIAPKNSITGCVGAPPSPINFDIYPRPIFGPVVNPDSICSEQSTNIPLVITNVGTASLSWTILYNGPNILGANAGASGTQPATIQDFLTNESTVIDSVIYRINAESVISSLKSCFSDTLDVVVRVNPKPETNNLPNIEFCSDTPNNGLIHVTDLTVLEPDISSPANTTITWFDADPALGGQPISAADEVAWPAQNSTSLFAEVLSTLPSACKDNVEVTFTVHNTVSMSLDTVGVSCNGAQDGQIIVTAQFGSGNYFYSIGSDPFISKPNPHTFDRLAPGKYFITIRDENGCTASDSSDVITQPDSLIAVLASKKDVSCFFDAANVSNRDGQIIIDASGGPTPGQYRYTLFPGGLQQTTNTYTNLRPGFYTIVVSDINLNACKSEVSSIEIEVPDPVEIESVDVGVDANGNNISCPGAENGEIRIVAKGGTGAFEFTLDPVHPNNPLSGLENETVIFDSLAANVYRIFVEDTNGCKAPLRVASIAPLIPTNPGMVGDDQDVCPESTATNLVSIIDPFGGTGDFDVRWQFSVTGNVADSTQWSTIAGQNSLTIDPNSVLDRTFSSVYYFRRQVRSRSNLPNAPAFCSQFEADDSNVVTLNLRDKPVVSIQGGADEVCEGETRYFFLQLDLGAVPMEFDAEIGTDLYPDRKGGITSQAFEVFNPETNPLVRFFNITDGYGCAADPVSRQVIFTPHNPDFTIADADQCSGAPFFFDHTPDPLVDYTWDYGDGSGQEPAPYRGDAPPTLPLEHVYAAGSTSVPTKYVVTLRAQHSLCGVREVSKPVTIFPTIIENILEPDNKLCSGETITFKDNSLGITSGTWHYEYTDGNGNGFVSNLVPRQSEVTFTIDNNSTHPDDNPLLVTVYYIYTNNQNCPTTPYTFNVEVYRKPDATFSFAPDPPQMVGGLVNVTYTITNYDAVFQYDWIDNPNIDSEIRNNDTREVNYTKDDPWEVTLIATNPAYPQCTHTTSLQIFPDVGTPSVGFAATPLEQCFPFTVTTENFSVAADNFEWTLTGSNGISEESGLREPQFRITTPGVYTLTMIAFRGTTVIGNPTSVTITAYDVPIADFLLRQPQVYIGQEVEPINRSLFALEYIWDFGDGDQSFEYQPKHFYKLEGKDSISLIAMYDHGNGIVCADTMKLPIHVIAGGALKIPNAFTPNVNGPNSGHEDLNFTNDVFLPIMEGVEEFTMQIFDRWGTLVFESKDKTIGWNGYDRNGRLMPAGVYVFKLVMRLGDGQRTTKVGDVTLIR
jgi:gliding motility-associated-like protein